MRGLPGCCARRRQQRRTPSRCQRSTVAGWISTRASRHLGHNQRKNSQNRRSAGRKRLLERARTPSWWRRARISSTRSRRVARADWIPALALMTARIACRVPAGDADVNDFAGRNIGEAQASGMLTVNVAIGLLPRIVCWCLRGPVTGPRLGRIQHCERTPCSTWRGTSRSGRFECRCSTHSS
jgi:hypothetical protein